MSAQLATQILNASFKRFNQSNREGMNPAPGLHDGIRACRDLFRRVGVLEKIIPAIDEILKAGGIYPPTDAPEAAYPEIPREEASGDDGHRG